VNHHFLSLWKQLDPVGSRNRGLLSLMRRHSQNLSVQQSQKLAAYLARHPALEAVYHFKQWLCSLLLNKHRTAKHCRQLAAQFL
jgi:transposase